MKVAFIGLGVMGYSIAGHLAKANLKPCVYNRTASKAQSWLSQFSGTNAASPALASNDSDLIITCVGNDNDLKEVLLGDQGVIQKAKPGAIVVDHSTTSAEVAREMAQHLSKQQIAFLDAPVSGGQQGAENGKLTIMCGGDNSAFETALPTLQHYAQKVTYMGQSGNGQLTKMVNQIAVTGLIQALAEAMQFAQQANLDVQTVINVISKGAAQSWQMDNRHQSMINNHYDHGFAVDLMRKDLGICLNEARNNGAQLPITALVDQFYAEIQAIDGGRWDTSSLLKRLQSFHS